MKYRIDLRTLLRIFSSQSGELRAHIRIPGIKEQGLAQIILESGKISTCRIESRNAVIMGDQALGLLQGELEWTYTPAKPPASLSAPAQNHTVFIIPIRTHEIASQELGRWPRQYVLVYNLIDAKRTSLDIARYLACSHQELMEILMHLYQMKVVAWTSGG